METVADRGDYAVRGGIVDLFPPGTLEPLRLDFFGDEPRRHPYLRRCLTTHHRPARRMHLVAGERSVTERRQH
ncbi:MAG: hypothetical protein IPK78_07820 [Rhodospirillales bacterium]|nr:hypothetical protein [Rhodospirillales bacterium]